LSSDPAMNWRLSALDRFTLISNSDAHSPIKLGREANVLDCDLDYDSVITAIKTRKGFLETLEFFPEEGKYHYDGHRNCGLLFSPKETKVAKGICPKCKKKLTVGVVHRVELLSDREEGFLLEKRIPYRSIVPLVEIIAASEGVESTSVKVKRLYFDILQKGCPEMDILLNLSELELDRVLPPKITMGVLNVRRKNLKITPGYDGVFGKVEMPFEEKEPEQMSLF
ncbi:endonuclease Q family protein, partial [bacterium]|nr:endonuclease Q family protein [bacterium]